MDVTIKKVRKELEKLLEVESEKLGGDLNERVYRTEMELRDWVAMVLEVRGLEGLFTGQYIKNYKKYKELENSQDIVHAKTYLIGKILEREDWDILNYIQVVRLKLVGNLESLSADLGWVKSYVEGNDFLEEIQEYSTNIRTFGRVLDEYIKLADLEHEIDILEQQLLLVESCLAFLKD